MLTNVAVEFPVKFQPADLNLLLGCGRELGYGECPGLAAGDSAEPLLGL